MNNFFDIQSILGNLSASNQASSSAQLGPRQTANPPSVIPLPLNGQAMPRPENSPGLFNNNDNNQIHLNATSPLGANPLAPLIGMLSVII